MGIFEPFRAIGYITNGVPFSVQRLGTETFVTVSVGKSFQVYNCAKLTVILVSQQLPNKIRALSAHRDFTLAAHASHIAIFKRAHQVSTWSRHNAKVSLLMFFGGHVLSVDVAGNIFVWAFEGFEHDQAPIAHIKLEDTFTPVCILHPDTYLNKVVLGSREGSLQLWNIGTKKKLYEFKGWNSSVTSCVSSPALDVIAVGCADGKIHVHNIRYDEGLVTFAHSKRGAVTALSFCSDGQPFLASGGSCGVISIWNLEKRMLQSVIKEAHDNSIVSLHFLASEPVLLSSSIDNSIKMWIFDTSDGDPRLLRFRSGHSAPPLCIRFYANGKHILSAGQDRAFRLFSTVQDQQSKELSQRKIAKRAKKLRVKEEELKLKPVIAFDCAEIRERDWCNVVTCHMDTTQAYVWRLQNFVLGDHILKPCPQNPTAVKACAISACGNYAVLGTSGGWVERFNLQSGISRGSYLDAAEKNHRAHAGQVVGVACDSTNTLMISAGFHGDVKVWNFKGLELKCRWEVGFSLGKIAYHRFNGLLATVADDLVVRLFDVLAEKMVRKFQGHTDRITDVCFSEDGKWLLSASMDGTLRVWDIILARQVDAIHVDISVTALSFSPNMDILATTHVDQNGVYLWVNQSVFSGAPSTGSGAGGKRIVSVSGCLPLVSSSLEPEPSEIEEPNTPPATNHARHGRDDAEFPLIQQIPDLVTLSLLPKAQWQTLINLDIIKVRNKPIEAPRKPEKAPFFLPSIPTLSGEVVFKQREQATTTTTTTEEQQKAAMGSGHVTRKDGSQQSKFVQLLQSSAKTNNFSEFTEFVKSLSPSSLDVELRMLQIVDDELHERPELICIELLLDYFAHEISSRNNFEFVQATVRLFLKIHGETISGQARLLDKAAALLEVHSSVWQRVDALFQRTRCMVTFFSNSQF